MAKRPAVRRGRKNPNADVARPAENNIAGFDQVASGDLLTEVSSNTVAKDKESGKRGASSEFLDARTATLLTTDVQAPDGHRSRKKEPEEEGLQIFPMSGAVDRTAEFETRRALNKKLDAILGISDDNEEEFEESVPVSISKTAIGGSARKKESRETLVTDTRSKREKDPKKRETDSKKTKEKVLNEQTSVLHAQNNLAAHSKSDESPSQPEITESGSVLFDAVLPKGKGVGEIRHSVKRREEQPRKNEDEQPLLESVKASASKHSYEIGVSKNTEPHADGTPKTKVAGKEHHKSRTSLHKKEIKTDDLPSEMTAPTYSEEFPGHVTQGAETQNAETANAGKQDKKSVSIYDLQKDKEAEELRIQAEVNRRVSRAEKELEPQVIISPKAARRSRLTVLFVALGVVALALISIIMGINYDRMNRTLAETNQELGFYKNLMNGENIQPTQTGDVAGTSVVTGTQVRKEDDIRRVYLTFDDGPSEVTVEILDILATYGVKATFFVNGKEDERSSYIYNRIVDEGHTLAMHGYSHDFDQIYTSVETFSEDLHKLRNLLYDKTGGRVWCKYYRFPGGSSTTTAKTDMKELEAYLEREGITYYDWNVYGGDDIPAATMISNIKSNSAKYKNVIILLHDAADKNATAMALPGIIEYLQGLDDTVLLPVSDDTVLVQHGMQ